MDRLHDSLSTTSSELSRTKPRFPSTEMERLRNQVFDNGATELAELLEAAGMIKGKLVVVEAEKSQQRNVEIADVGFAFNCGHSKFIGGTNRVTSVAAATGQPNCHCVWVMIATVGRAAAHSVVRRAAKLAAPDDERAFEQTAMLEIRNERGDGLIDAAHEIAVGALDVVMAIP